MAGAAVIATAIDPKTQSVAPVGAPPAVDPPAGGSLAEDSLAGDANTAPHNGPAGNNAVADPTPGQTTPPPATTAQTAANHTATTQTTTAQTTTTQTNTTQTTKAQTTKAQTTRAEDPSSTTTDVTRAPTRRPVRATPIHEIPRATRVAATSYAAVPKAPAKPLITTRTQTETRTIPFTTKVVNDASLARGVKRVTSEGVAGVRTLRYVVTLSNGRQISRRLLDSRITRQPRGKVVALGVRDDDQSQDTGSDTGWDWDGSDWWDNCGAFCFP